MKNIIYKTGDFIQKIIIRNILLFITLGFIKWLAPYKPEFYTLSEIFTKYVIPLSVGYTTGSMIDKKHGGPGGIIGTALIIYTTLMGNLLEVILVSSLVSWTIKMFKEKILTKVIPGFEMFLINISVPMIALVYYFIFLKIIPYINIFFNGGTDFILGVGQGILGIGIITMFIEISKIFFINNFINHGILALVGYKQIMEQGQSLFFLLETNPGPGLGVLLALYLFMEKKRDNIISNIVVEFFGGIHEMYFPYVLKNLKLIFALICGGLTGNLFFYAFNSALSSVPSPGSVIVIMMLASTSRFYILMGIFLSAAVSFGTAYVILSLEDKKEMENNGVYLTEKIEKNMNDKKQIENIFNSNKNEKILISILCNGGMGSSHIGKTFLQNIVNEKNIKNIEINSTYIGDNVKDSHIIITHNNFVNKVKLMYPNSVVAGLEDYVDKDFYSEFAENYLMKNREKKIEVNISEIEDENINAYVDCQIKLGLKSIYEDEAVEVMKKEIGGACENSVFLPNGLIFISNINEANSEKIIVHQYPYGIKDDEDKNNFLVVGACVKNIEHQEKILKALEKISKSSNIMSDLEISDSEEEFKEIFVLENLLRKGGV